MKSVAEAVRFAEYSAAFHSLLGADSQSLVAALNNAAPLVASAVGAELVDAFLYNPQSDALIALSTEQSHLADVQRERKPDALPLSEGGLIAKVFRDGSPYLTG